MYLQTIRVKPLSYDNSLPLLIGQANRRDSDKEHLQKIAQELQDILHQLHNTKSAQYYVWSGDTFGHTPDTETKTLGSRYEVHYLHGKVTDEDLMAERPFINSAPDAERFQQDVWEPGSRGGGEGNLLGGKYMPWLKCLLDLMSFDKN